MYRWDLVGRDTTEDSPRSGIGGGLGHVMRTVEAQGYTPNYAAKSLRTMSSRRIIMTVPDISNPFFSSILRGADQ